MFETNLLYLLYYITRKTMYKVNYSTNTFSW